jgi:hypothetical protein
MMQVRCLDFIDFGYVQLPKTMPRIEVWRGKLIKVFRDMYIGTYVNCGAYPVS